MNKCGYFIRKTGGYYYGIKCEGYHHGTFPLYISGSKLIYHKQHGDGVGFNKEDRDNYVKEKCLKDCTNCTLFQGLQSHC